MSQLQFFTVLSALWLALAWVPYILDRILVRGLMGALANPSPQDKPQSPWAQRAHRAHIVGVELFVAFAPLSLLASILMPTTDHPGGLGAAFFFGMLIHYIVYVLGIPVARTAAFAVAAISSILLGLSLLSMG